MSPFLLFLCATLALSAQTARIVRDDWGIAHVYGKTDADAVFGAIYAQAEDDFARIETNYLNSLGRLAEAEGERRVIQDLRMKLFIDPAELQKQYAASPTWLKKLMNAWAAGLNHYLAKHPEVKPRVIAKFEPWMALSFTEGSIGGDIESISLANLEAFYARKTVASREAIDWWKEPTGSNGISIAPANTKNGKALFLINPHTSFYFRSELQMVSGEGLNAYGASTWGQFFIYQGFNEGAGWMHTSSGIDTIDEWLETVTEKADGVYYKYGGTERKMTEKIIAVPYKTATGMAERKFRVFYSHRGPIIRMEGGKWVSVRLMQEPVKALMQSYSRTKAKNLAAFRKTMELRTNSSNNTLFADSQGNIAYFHGNFLPKRGAEFDYSKPVDGSNPATDWQGLHAASDLPIIVNPKSGWVYNANDWPWEAAGPDSPKRENYPKYVENGGPSARGKHAVMVLENKKDFTLDGLLAAAYDTRLPWFTEPIAALKAAYVADENLERKRRIAEAVGVLTGWDQRWSVDSVATSLGIYWGTEIRPRMRGDVKNLGREILLVSLEDAMRKLAQDFGKWQTPWGEINRFQRLSGAITPSFDDAKSSLPIGFPSGNWGSLASYGARPYANTKRWYGTSGNSFVAVVEFGAKVKARAISAGGESGDPASKHFNDQAERYSKGDLREVYFYKEQLASHTEKEYSVSASAK